VGGKIGGGYRRFTMKASILDLRQIDDSPKETYVPTEYVCACHDMPLITPIVNGVKYESYCPVCRREQQREFGDF
jgi:hypothetical protein